MSSNRVETVPVLKVTDRLDAPFKLGRGTPVALGTGAQTITAAAIAGEIATCAPSAANDALTLVTAQILHDYMKPAEIEVTHDFFLINTSATSANIGLVTVPGASGWTSVGSLYVAPVGAPLTTGLASSAHFRIRWTAIGSAATAVLYRLA
jgi:hypothetical protein